MRTFKFQFIAWLLLLFTFLAFSQGSWTNNAVSRSQPYGEIINFTCTVDSIDTLTSSTFKLGKYDGVSWSTLPFELEYILTSTLGTPKITGYVQGSFDGSNWHNIDTLFTDFTTETRTRATLDLNNHKRPVYRVVIYGVATNRSDTAFDMDFFAYQENY